MRCPNCQNDNPPNLSTCDWCGAPLPQARKSSTLVEGATSPPPSRPAVSNPSEKRKTLYEPSSAPSYTRPPADDFFGNPPPARPAPQDPDDPFAQSIRPQAPAPAPAPPPARPVPVAAPAPAPAYVPPPAAPALRRSAGHSRTIVENPTAGGRRLRGALFVFRGQDAASGVIKPLHEGRNSLGRSEDRDIVLDDGRVSSEHGFLFIRQDRHTYVDTSTNGSRVDGKIVYGEQIEVRSGSVIEAGSLRLVVVTIPPEALST